MPDIFRDPVWQFMGVVIGVIALLVSIIIALRGRRTKALTYRVLSRHALLTVSSRIAQKVQVLYDGTPVRDITLLTIRFDNTGTVPITTQDVERPIAVVLNDEAQILLADLDAARPTNLGATIDQAPTRVTLQPVLLNPGDGVAIWMMVTGLKKWQIDGRVVGVTEIAPFKERPWLGVMVWGYFGGALLFLALVLLTQQLLFTFLAVAWIATPVVFIFIGERLQGTQAAKRKP